MLRRLLVDPFAYAFRYSQHHESESVKAHDQDGTHLKVAHETAAGCCRHDVVLRCYTMLGIVVLYRAGRDAGVGDGCEV